MVPQWGEAAREVEVVAQAAKPEGMGAGQPAESAASGRSLSGSDAQAAGSSIRSAAGAAPSAAAAAPPIPPGEGAQPLFREPRGTLKVLNYSVDGKLADDMLAVAEHWLENELYLPEKTKRRLNLGGKRPNGRPPPKVPIKSLLGIMELRSKAVVAEREKRSNDARNLRASEKQCCESAAAAIEGHLGLERDEPVDVAWLLRQGLRGSPGILTRLVKQYEVDRTDRREALWGKRGLQATCDISICSFLGTYAGTLQYKSDYEQELMHERSTGRYNGNKLELDTYAADLDVYRIAREAHWYKAVPRLEDENPEDLDLTISAKEGGNILCFVNDRNIIPSLKLCCSEFKAKLRKKYDTPDNMVGGAANCDLYTLILGPWLLPALFTLDNVVAGEDLGYSYGLVYWSDHQQQYQLAQGELEFAGGIGLAGVGDAAGGGPPLRSTVSGQNPPDSAAAGAATVGVGGRQPWLEPGACMQELGAVGLSRGGGGSGAAAKEMAAAAGTSFRAGLPIVVATALMDGSRVGKETLLPGNGLTQLPSLPPQQQQQQEQMQAELQPGPASPTPPAPLPGTPAAFGSQPQSVLVSGGTAGGGSSGRRCRIYGARVLSERKARTKSRSASQVAPRGGSHAGTLGTKAAAAGPAGQEQGQAGGGAGGERSALIPRHLSFDGPDVGEGDCEGEEGMEEPPLEKQKQEQQQKDDERGPPAEKQWQPVEPEQEHGPPASGTKGGAGQGPSAAAPRSGGRVRTRGAAGGLARRTRQRAQQEGGAGGVVEAEGAAEQEPESAAQRAVSEALADLEQVQVAYVGLGWDQESWTCVAGSLEGELYSAEILLYLHEAGQLGDSVWTLQGSEPLGADAVVEQLLAGKRQLQEAEKKLAAALERKRQEGAAGEAAAPAAAAAEAEMNGGGAGAGVEVPELLEQQPAAGEAEAGVEAELDAAPVPLQLLLPAEAAAAAAGGAKGEPEREVGGQQQHEQFSPAPAAEVPQPPQQPTPAARPANPTPNKTPAKAAARQATAAMHPAKKAKKTKRGSHHESLSPQGKPLVQATLPPSWLSPSKAAEQRQQAQAAHPSQELQQQQQMARQGLEPLPLQQAQVQSQQEAQQQMQPPSLQQQAAPATAQQAALQKGPVPVTCPSQQAAMPGDVLSVGMHIAVRREGQVQQGRVEHLGASSPDHEHPLVLLQDAHNAIRKLPTPLFLLKDKRKVGIMQLVQDGHWAVLPPGEAGPSEGLSPAESAVRAAPGSSRPAEGEGTRAGTGIANFTWERDEEQQGRCPTAQPVAQPLTQPLVTGQQPQAAPAAVPAAATEGKPAAACAPLQGVRQRWLEQPQQPRQGIRPPALTPGGCSALHTGLVSHSGSWLGLEGRLQERGPGGKPACKRKANPQRKPRQGGSTSPQLATAGPGTAGPSALKPLEPQLQQRLSAGNATKGGVFGSVVLAAKHKPQAAVAPGQGASTGAAGGVPSSPLASLPVLHPAVKTESAFVEAALANAAAAAPAASLPPIAHGAVGFQPPPPGSVTPAAAAAAATQPPGTAAGVGSGGHARKKLKEAWRTPGQGPAGRGVAELHQGALAEPAAAQPAGRAPPDVIDLTLDSDED